MPHDEIATEGRRDSRTIVKLQEHPEHRWGLVVDLDLCTGCGACSVACYAENNIPVVGSEEVGRGRELSWIRLEKHVFDEGPDERWRFLPVMCQQCDKAPCETVCPVFAAYHTKDGLNAQIYNRCVGTRYCSNNCPYKVRRFNYFDYEREEPGNQQLNPDVTVRSRGVMEKCTFCVQRIREVTNRAKVDKRPVSDGEIQPACVQTCPTGALVFGDFKQQDWTMSRLARDPRGYRLLDFHANTRPGVVYLRKVDSDPEKV
jgi:molybdopterin-containing oxidoreductase family iron-sulfur binding subunit